MTESDTFASGDPAVRLEEGLPTPQLLAPDPPSDGSSRFQLSGRSLREHVARGTVTNALYLVFLSTLTLVRGFVLALFLTRADYGVWGILMVSLSALLWLKQVGISDKYIQQDERDQELAFQKAFTLELIFTMIWVLLLAAAVPAITFAYGEPKLLAPGLVLVLMLPAGALQAPLWAYYRQMEFVKQRTLQGGRPRRRFRGCRGPRRGGCGLLGVRRRSAGGSWAAALVAIVFSPSSSSCATTAGPCADMRASRGPC
jgi:hypothetical protein